jgi:hypothetical protein
MNPYGTPPFVPAEAMPIIDAPIFQLPPITFTIPGFRVDTSGVQLQPAQSSQKNGTGFGAAGLALFVAVLILFLKR